MTADLIMTAGPFFGINAQPEVVRLQTELARRGCPHIRAHRRGSWLIIEAWRAPPDDPGDLPSDELCEALIHGEIPAGVVQQ